jgi:hypothetical protein
MRKPAGKLPPGPGFKPDRKFITPQEFGNLPDKGFVDPQRIRTSQKAFNEKFGVPFIRGIPESQEIQHMVKGLKSGDIKSHDVRPIQLVEWRGHIYTVDHRRLIAFRRAGFDIPYQKVRLDDLSIGKQDRIRTAPRWNDNGSFIPNQVTREME